MKSVPEFVKEQLASWPMASRNFRLLDSAESKSIRAFGITVRAQVNPCRIISSTAEVDAASIASRPCFLCTQNRPAEQTHMPLEVNGRSYRLQVNPYPIFEDHLVIALDAHRPQESRPYLADMLALTSLCPDFLIFYNGPYSGASAPDHMHFQACHHHALPLQDAVDAFLDSPVQPLISHEGASLYLFPGYVNGTFAIKGSSADSVEILFLRLLGCCETLAGEPEPRFNLYAYFKDGQYRLFIILRTGIRSHHYYAKGDDHLTMSPGAADMAGHFVVPDPEDFPKLDGKMIEGMLQEVTISSSAQEGICRSLKAAQRKVEVGIMSAEEICFVLGDGKPRTVRICDGRISYEGQLYGELSFAPSESSDLFAGPSFTLRDVTIGIDFHWEQKRDLQYAGELKFIVEGDRLTAVNVLGIEDYLLSVISSEMKSSSSVELLKAHAVISRSWLMARMEERACPETACKASHQHFDVCADDHCQRYQGVAMAAGDKVRKAISATWGQTLRYGGTLCDARYSKCCGGITERFSSCWEDVDFPYLQPVLDNDGGRDFCDCEDDAILSQVLNDYDLKTRDFYHWRVRYSADELSALVRRRTGRDVGRIVGMEPLLRGASGRIVRLRINGTFGSMELGKELAIRRALSDSHLKSSAFEVLREGDDFILEGKGWGHGVGLCQIGAAVMAGRGYTYKEILKHYYRGAEIE